MLVYQATKADFMDDVETDAIVERITTAFERKIHRPNPAEVRSWQNSMQFMYKVLNTTEVPGGCGVAIEFGVPYTPSRIDFLLTGRTHADSPPPRDAAVIIELKQWKEVECVTGKDGIVRTFVGGSHREVPHPSYQAWSYARMIEDYNEAVRDASIGLQPCAYLHNYRVTDPQSDPLLDPSYSEYLDQAPVFCAGDIPRLREFICRSITAADDGQVLYHIESGRLRPSKSLQDALADMLEGNPEFTMIDDQKVVFETAASLALRANRTNEKQVMIVKGGPGTGKSVVAVNLLVHLTREGLVTQYISKNAAPRNVYSALLSRRRKGGAYIKNLFRGPDKFYELPADSFDALVIDEGHRLREKSGLYGNLGENQIAELIASSRFSVFFIDESQRVTFADAGTVADIEHLARSAGAHVFHSELNSQFRCNGSDSYLTWLDDILGIAPADEAPTLLDYDFRVFDSPHDLAQAIEQRNADANRSRIVAGYCWEWPKDGKGDPDHHDIVIPEQGFARSWNLNTSDTWAIDDGSIEQIGCIHTCQGLEFDYVGVIIGDDLRYSGGQLITDASRRAKSDKSLNGLKKLSKTDPERAARIADRVIRNTYRVLMTRGMKGCYVYCTDSNLAEYLRGRIPALTYKTTPESLSFAADQPEE